jgi:hypothetical protein
MNIRRMLPTQVAAVGALAASAYWLLFRPRMSRWGATDEEVQRVVPGDEVPNAMGDRPVSTRAITIDAPPEEVWPWLVQMGSGRAGFYTHEWVERLLLINYADGHSSTRIHPEWQELRVGDRVPYSRINTVPVVLVDPPRALWAGEHLVLEPLDGGTRTRLIARTRGGWVAPFARKVPVLWPLIWPLAEVIDRGPGELLHHYMETGMLKGIKARVEAANGSAPVGVRGREESRHVMSHGPATSFLRWVRRTRGGGAIEYLAQYLDGLARPELLRPGATSDEERRPLPGDDLVPSPLWEATRAVSIDAPAVEVWPWVAQMGYGRGGWYGWNPLEREDTGVGRLLDEAPPRVGDVWLDGPGCDKGKGAFTVKAVDPPRTLVLHSVRNPITGRELDPGRKWRLLIDTAWAFHLDEIGPGRTRLLARTRIRIVPRQAIAALRWMGGGDTVMQRRLLDGIKARTEAAHRPLGSISALSRVASRSRAAAATTRDRFEAGAREAGVR